MRTQHLLKHRHRTILLAAALFAVMVALLAGCGTGDEASLVPGDAVDSTGGEPAADLQTAAPATTVSDAEAADEDPGEDASEELPDEPVAAAPDQANACLNCHSDKEQLIATAGPVLELEAESEGEG